MSFLLSGIIEVIMKKIAVLISVGIDDPPAIIASNGIFSFQMFQLKKPII